MTRTDHRTGRTGLRARAAALLCAGLVAGSLAATSPAGALERADGSRPRTDVLMDTRLEYVAPETGPSTPKERRRAKAEQRRERKQLNRELVADRRAALAAMWQPDPVLLTPRPTDSVETLVVRSKLAAVAARLREASATYFAAQRRSDQARRKAARAGRALVKARSEEAAARVQYELDRDALVAVVTRSYSTESMGPLALVLSAESDDDLFSGMTLLRQVGLTQTDAVVAAEESARRLAEATVMVARKEALTAARARRAVKTLARADRSRAAVTTEARAAQRLLRESVLVDEIASAVDADELTEASARAAADLPGGVVFPLPEDAEWVDNDNWGRKGKMWARGHTGDDFSVGCGTPVFAATSGTVRIFTDQGWAGPHLVTVEAAEGGLSTWYAHMQAVAVADGDEVKAGAKLGAVGTEGNSSGCHLHFEVHPLGGSIYEDNIDPVAWLRIARAYPLAD